MKFDVLFHWTRQEHGRKRIQRMICHSELYEIRFIEADSLYLFAGKGEAFPFWAEPSGGHHGKRIIFSQIEKTDLTGIALIENDRIIRFDLQARDIYHQNIHYVLIFECIPPIPNLILCQAEPHGLKILEAVHQYSLADNPQRQILPGLIYQPPRTSYLPPPLSPRKQWMLALNGQTLTFDDANDYLAAYYEQVIIHRQKMELQALLIREWKRNRDKKQRKADAQTKELEDAQQAEKWYQHAEIIKYNLAKIRKGQTRLDSVNYFEPGAPAITIMLDPTLDPVRNMQAYIKKYHKARNGAAIIAKNLAQSIAEVRNIDQIIQRIEAGEIIHPESPKGGCSVRYELSKLDKLLRLRINEDWEIAIGTKARENDFVSIELGRAHDWWFHTRIYRGAHVLLRNFAKKEPPHWLVEICCALAAYYSKARFSRNVPVDYTQIRYVRKPRKSPAGFVTYTNHHTVFADPMDLRSVKTMLPDEK